VKGAVFRSGCSALQIEDVPDPAPGPHRVVIKVARCGICGGDMHLADREHPKVESGAILGHEYAGEVVAIGRDVKRLSVGDRIAPMPILGCGHCAACMSGDPARCASMTPAFGGFAQYAVVGERECIKLPSTLSLADSALVEPLAVALHGINAAVLRPGAHILVQGAGPIGLGIIHWARQLGASRIDVVEGVDSRKELAMAAGANSCSPPRAAAQAYAFGAADALGDFSDAPEVVFECVGKPGLLASAIETVRPGGAVVSLGFCMTPDGFTPGIANTKEVTLKFPCAYTLREFAYSADALDAGTVKPSLMVTDTIGLDELPIMFEELRTTASQCKVLVDPWR
jgi:threonine dehydrogenase-like Zn-dependent dehydrogenase